MANDESLLREIYEPDALHDDEDYDTPRCPGCNHRVLEVRALCEYCEAPLDELWAQNEAPEEETTKPSPW